MIFTDGFQEKRHYVEKNLSEQPICATWIHRIVFHYHNEI